MLAVLSKENYEKGKSMSVNFNKKLLIYVNEVDLKPTGGASGYNYNMQQGLQHIGAKNYSFLKGVDQTRNKFKALKDGALKRSMFVVLRILNYKLLLEKKKSYAKVNLDDYEVVHFHNVKDMYEARTSLENYNGIVVLTSHSPKPFSFEIYEDVISDFEKRVFGKMYKKLIVMEKYAFKRANYIIFPCEDAEEPYYKKWKEYKKIHDENAEKYRYMLTGTKECKAKISKKEYRKEKQIPEDAFVVSYAGRHNQTKGYDKLKKIGQQLLQQEDVYFMIAGKEEPLKGLEHPHWREIGWTNDPHSLINASDVFVLPNEETYFDLIMLEVLSLGKIVIASRTGGNKFFEKIDAPGVMLYSDEKQAIELIEKVKHMSQDERAVLEKRNYKLFKEKFSNPVFAQNYVNIINDLK